MSTLSQFGGGMPVTKLMVGGTAVNGYSTNNYMGYGGTASQASSLLSGAMTANTLKTVINITGAGCFDFLGFQKQDATARTVRCKITIDGNVAYDYTSASGSDAGGANIIGDGYGGYTSTVPLVYFKSSFLLEMASSLTETDKIKIFRVYRTF